MWSHSILKGGQPFAALIFDVSTLPHWLEKHDPQKACRKEFIKSVVLILTRILGMQDGKNRHVKMYKFAQGDAVDRSECRLCRAASYNLRTA
jgi:hypothetical protein